MEENMVLSKIILPENSVSYFSLQSTFNVSPLESQLLLKNYIDENKDSIATYLNYLTDDNMNHVLSISDCSLANNSIISLKKGETYDVNHIDLYMTHNELDKRNPPIVSDEIYLLSNTSPGEVKHDQPVKQEPMIKLNALTASKINNCKSSITINKLMNSTREKETKSTTSLFSKKPVNNESSSKSKVSANDDSDFEFSDNDNIIPATQVLPIQSKLTSKKMEKKLEVIAFKDLTHSDIVCKKSSGNKTKNSVTKPKLFENFENVSPKKSLLKRRRLVIESDEEDENEKVLVNASFEEAKPAVPLRSHHSKRFKTDNKPKQAESETVIKKEVFETTSKSALKKVERTYEDEEGFLVVEKVLVPINSEENLNTIKEKPDLVKKSANPVKLEKKTGKKSQPKQIESNRKQTNIMSFFQKN